MSISLNRTTNAGGYSPSVVTTTTTTSTSRHGNQHHVNSDVILVEEDELEPASLAREEKENSRPTVTTIKCGKKPLPVAVASSTSSAVAGTASMSCDRRKSNVSFVGSILNLDEAVSANPPTKSKSSSSSSSIRINERLRSVLDLFRHRIGNSNPTTTTTTTTSTSASSNSKKNNKSSTATTSCGKKSSSSSKKSSRRLSNDLAKNQATTSSSKEVSTTTAATAACRMTHDGLEICQLCYIACHVSENEAIAAVINNNKTKTTTTTATTTTTTTTTTLNYMYPLETCEHGFCVNCLRQYLKYQIIEARVSISCPQCSEKMHPNDIYRLLKLKLDIPTITPSSPPLTTTTTSKPPVTVAVVVDDPRASMLSTTSSSSSSSASPLSNHSLIDSSTSSSSSSSSSSNKNSTQQPTTSSSKPTSDNEWSQLIEKYEEFMVRRVLVSIPDVRFCPAPDCSFAVIASGCANCPQLHCMRPNCNTSFCYHCKQRWHPNLTCEDAALRSMAADPNSIMTGTLTTTTSSSHNHHHHGILRTILGRSNSHLSSSSSMQGINIAVLQSNSSPTTTAAANAAAVAANVASTSGAATSAAMAAANSIFASRNVNGDWIKEEIKRCPKCQALIVKMDDGSCNHITCSVCGCEFCWLCMKEISDLHYLSPSGCTFWGKKPWSRKKKIMWQLGTLVGAPVGIALIAGVAVPAILIGLPIWAGRKVYIRYKNIGKHKRNTIVVGTVFGTILVAPLVAALAVGIGVPILLAYVYGVVPISLCRSGGCGVTTNNNGGVRFAFDDEPTTTVDNSASASYFNQTMSTVAATANAVAAANATTSLQAAAAIPTTTATTAAVVVPKITTTNERDRHDSMSSTASSSSVTFRPTNSVTIPISAIDPAADIIVADRASSSSPSIDHHDNNHHHYGGAGMNSVHPLAATSTSTSSTTNHQTPLFVTITMGSKHHGAAAAAASSANPNATSTTFATSVSSTSGSTHVVKGRQTQSPLTNKYHRSTSSHRNNKQEKHRSNNNSCNNTSKKSSQSPHHHHHHTAQIIRTPTKMSSTASTSASMMLSSASIACGTVELDKSSTTSHQQHELLQKSQSQSQQQQQQQPQQINYKNSENVQERGAGSETGTALNYLTNASNNNNNNNHNNVEFKKTNPSIGEVSFGGEDLSLDDLEYMEDQSRRTNNNNNNNNRIVKIIKRHLVVDGANNAVGRQADTAASNASESAVAKRNSATSESDRDSASNRGLAGDLASMKSRLEETNSNNTKTIDVDLKSNYTINSYKTTTTTQTNQMGGGASLNVGGTGAGDMDAYSVSIVSDTAADKQSIDPSMAALAGSIKDNMSVGNLST